MKDRLSPRMSNENVHPKVLRSRSIDSIDADDQTAGSHSSGENFNDDKPQSTTTIAKTLRTFRKRLSRTSYSNKSEQKRRTSNQRETFGKSGGDDSEASSTGEGGVHISFQEIPTSNSDLPSIEKTSISTAVSLKVHRSLPAEKTPSIITSSPPPPPLSELNEKRNDSASSSDNLNLSKTWSSPTFTGAQLHGTCSLEYTEHMKDKSHKRKAHMIDLRKDDVQHQQQSTTNTMTSTSKHSISRSFTSYNSYTLTPFNNKNTLT